MVVTHEMGHLIGSRHTHACVWNGNNTAIDGCEGQTEGSCSLPGYPSGGGTIMSYCHLQSVGINFNNGFGTQPGNVIRNTVANANCLTPCGSGPSCNDGIQNGDETGVDCGGSTCPPCPTCFDGIQNGDETGVDCGGSCPPCPEYCGSQGNNTNYEYIQSVTVSGNFTNNSGDNNGYADYTNYTVNANAGSSVSVSLTPGFAGSIYTERWRVWVDFNGDYDFNDSGELVLQSVTSGTASGSFTVPSGAISGTTRMRVSMKYGSYPSPCETFTYGEVEDYSFNISGGTGIVGDPFEGNNSLSIRSNQDQIEHSVLKINPVPASEFVSIEALHLLEEPTELTICDMYGQVLLKENIPVHAQQYYNRMDVSAYSAGMYIVLITQESQQISKRFIVIE